MKNKSKLLSVILILALLICAFPVTVSAAEYEPADGDTLDISTGDVITIGEGMSVTLNGSSAALTNVRITCEAGVNLTLQNVIINNSSNSGVCPLTFTGAGSKLILESGTASTLTGGALAPGISAETSAELTVENNGTLTANGGSNCAGLQCPGGATLTVSGEGTLNATGISGGAGIGGGRNAACGSITINSGTVIAKGGATKSSQYYHGINGGVITISGGTFNSGNSAFGGIGGNSNEGSSISITGGTVTAMGAAGATGIGGMGSLGCDVTITGGTVTATSNKVAAIGVNNTITSFPGSVVILGGTVTALSYGSGYAGIYCSSDAAGTVTIAGGTVTATGCYDGPAGICGSRAGTGTVTISGGTVTAVGGTAGVGICGGTTGTGSVTISGGMVYTGGGTSDLGSGLAETEETLTITGTAMVFLQNNSCTTTAATTHINETYQIGTTEVYGAGISVPDTWTTDFGAYLRSCTLSYDANGGGGAVPESVTRLYNTAVTLSDGSGLSRASYHFDGWNTAPGGTGTNYAAGANYTMPAGGDTLYAQWTAAALTGTASIDDTTPEFGQTLTASLTGGNNTGTLSYQWKRGAANIGTNSATYTLVADDVGQTITVSISSSVQTGTLTSDPTSSVDKADCATATGVTPMLDGKTYVSITLTVVADYEYLLVADGAAVGAGTWQDSNVFTSLSASTAYDIYQRVKETATHKASGTSVKLDVTTNAAPSYSASVSPTSKTFAVVGIGYGTVAAQDFTITNDGSGTITNLSATLEGSDFEISAAPASSISSAGTATVSVRPVTGLSSGDYTDNLTISADNGISLTVTLSFTVLAPTIDPASRNYDLNAPADITTTITWNGATSVTDAVYSINSDVTIYTLDTGDYTIVGNDLTIESSFFEDLSLTADAALDFVFTFNTRDEAALAVNVVDGFVPVTGIIGVPDTATAGTPLTLTGTVAPGNATNQTVTWSVYNAGDTGASVAGNILSTTAAGAVVVRATITNGQAASTDYTQDFNITVSAVPVTTYNVTFSSNGSAYATKTVNAGESIGSGNFPSDPTRSSYSFGGWFTGENGAGTEFTSATSVNATMTVYAKWTYSGGGGGSETTSAPTEKTITVTETSSEVFKDAAGTITAEANMDNAFSNSVEVKVTDTPKDAASFGLGAADEVYPFDISLYIKGTNEKTEPAADYAVTISLPIPENLLDKKELLSVVHESGSGGVTEITSRLVQKDGVWYLVFEATEFSPYALVVRNAESYDESAGVPYYLDANDNKVFVGFAANGKYISLEGVTVSVMQNDKSFTDITGHWAAGHIGFVTEREIFVGTGGNTFSPDTGMTRAMFATVIGRLYKRSYGEIEASSTHAFTDCDYDDYYGKYADWASENSIIGGVGEGKFAPDTLITREQMAVILYRFADFLGVLPNGMDTALSYPDAGSISGYAKTAALYCQTTGVIGGRTGGVFAPQETATRDEVATILQRFVEVVMK